MKLRQTYIACISVVLTACGGSSDVTTFKSVKSPKANNVVEEFREVHARAFDQDRSIGALRDVEVITIEHIKREPVALVDIKYTNARHTETLKLVFRMTDDGWQIYDREMSDPNSSTSLAFGKSY